MKIKSIIMMSLCFGLISGVSFAGKVGSNCTFKGISLKGNVQVVTSFPDLKVRVVNSFPDLKVKKVNSLPNGCGEWKMVDSLGDFKIQFVNSFEDVAIQYVTSLPGVN